MQGQTFVSVLLFLLRWILIQPKPFKVTDWELILLPLRNALPMRMPMKLRVTMQPLFLSCFSYFTGS